MFDSIIEWVLGILSASIGLLIAMVSYTWKSLKETQDILEVRVRSLEQSSVREEEVRRLIEDSVAPLRTTQYEIKDDQKEMRSDIKEILKLSLERRG